MLLLKNAVFFDFLDELADRVVACAEDLHELVSALPADPQQLQHIRTEKHKAHEVARHISSRLGHAFQPPIGGEDVYDLADALDGIVDTIDSLAVRLDAYRVESLEPGFLEQTEVLLEAAKRVDEAVHQLRRTHRLSELSPTLVEIHRLENLGDDHHHATLFRLFDGSFDPLFVLKWRELHARVETAIDKCEDVANVLERIALKNA